MASTGSRLTTSARPSPSKPPDRSDQAPPPRYSAEAPNSPVGGRQMPSKSQPQFAGHDGRVPSLRGRQSRWHSPSVPLGRHSDAPFGEKVSQSSWASTTPLPHAPAETSGRDAQPAAIARSRQGMAARAAVKRDS